MQPILERLPEFARHLPETIKKVPYVWRIARVISMLAQKVFGYSSGIYIWVSPNTYLFSAIQIPISAYYLFQSLTQLSLNPLHAATTFGRIGILGNHTLHFFQSKSFANLFETMSVTGRLTAGTIELNQAQNQKKIMRTRIEITAIVLDIASKAIFAWTPYTIAGTSVYVISTLVSFSKYLYNPSHDN